MLRFLTSPRFILPLILLLGLILGGVTLQDAWDLVSSGRLLTTPALAETKADAAATDKKADAPVVNVPSMASDKPAAPDKTNDATSGLGAPPEEDVSPAETEVLKQLSARRDELEKRDKALDTRESLDKITEQRVDQKIKEMQTLRLQLQSMIGQVSEAQQTQIDNLVKVYEAMKPDDAAKIFEGLDMPTLLSVLQRMKPKSIAPVMAKMTPEKAKDITLALTKQDQLPQVK